MADRSGTELAPSPLNQFHRPNPSGQLTVTVQLPFHAQPRPLYLCPLQLPRHHQRRLPDQLNRDQQSPSAVIEVASVPCTLLCTCGAAHQCCTLAHRGYPSSVATRFLPASGPPYACSRRLAAPPRVGRLCVHFGSLATDAFLTQARASLILTPSR